MRLLPFLVPLCFAFTALLQGQEPLLDAPPGLTGHLRLDLQLSSMNRQSFSFNLQEQEREEERSRKSPLRAAIYSALLPGAGEFYAESYYRAGGFFLAEVALWAVYLINDSKGDHQTALFQRYADDHWSVVRYAEWIERYAAQLNPDATGCSGLVTGPRHLPPWDRVDWPRLNACEEQIGRKSGNGFTHRLPRRPEQQYYELIGKYPQYMGGWDDGTDKTPADITSSNVSPRFREYSAMRGKANDYYNVASTMASIIVLNHVLSALDAAWSASQYNSKFSFESHLRPVLRSPGFIEFVPTAVVRYKL